MAEPLPLDDALLGKFLAGETSPAETARVQAWLAKAPAAAPAADQPSPADFTRFAHIWQAASPPASPVDVDAAWQAVQQQLRAQAAGSAPAPVGRLMRAAPPRPARFRWPLLRLVALLAVGIALGWLGWRQRLHPVLPVAQRTVTTASQRQTVVLPDGTTILLNRRATLRYPVTFDTVRAVALTGEAFFEVTPDPRRPFRIQAGSTTVQVVGTSFSVQADAARVRVAVRTGQVRFAAGGRYEVLAPGQQATYETRTNTLRRAPGLSPNVFAFRTGQLVFDHAPLQEVLQTVNAEYAADLSLADAQLGRRCRLTTRFDHASLATVVARLTQTLGLRVRQQGRRLILAGASCRDRIGTGDVAYQPRGNYRRLIRQPATTPASSERRQALATGRLGGTRPALARGIAQGARVPVPPLAFLPPVPVRVAAAAGQPLVSFRPSPTRRPTKSADSTWLIAPPLGKVRNRLARRLREINDTRPHLDTLKVKPAKIKEAKLETGEVKSAKIKPGKIKMVRRK